MAITARQGIAGALGDIKKRQEGVRSCRGGLGAVIRRWRYLLASGIYQLVSGAFLSDLERSWGYQSIWELIWDIYDVHMCSPWMEGASCSDWCTWFGGSKRWSQKVDLESEQSEKDSNFKQISAIKGWSMIGNRVTSEISWIGRDMDLENIVAKK